MTSDCVWPARSVHLASSRWALEKVSIDLTLWKKKRRARGGRGHNTHFPVDIPLQQACFDVVPGSKWRKQNQFPWLHSHERQKRLPLLPPSKFESLSYDDHLSRAGEHVQLWLICLSTALRAARSDMPDQYSHSFETDVHSLAMLQLYQIRKIHSYYCFSKKKNFHYSWTYVKYSRKLHSGSS